MAKKQRGKTSSEKADGGKRAEILSMAPESSDDEAPEEVTFADSRAEALRSMKRALDTARREKELLKEKRRKRQELFQEQKKRKLLLVEEEIDSSVPKKQKQPEEEEEEEEDKKKKKKEKKKEKKTSEHSRNLKGNYMVTTMKDQTQTSFQQQAAQDFIQSRLYGPGSCRTTSSELLSLQNKTGANKSAAVQFVKKNWACKEKAKAEKLKKRWIHKQRVPSS